MVPSKTKDMRHISSRDPSGALLQLLEAQDCAQLVESNSRWLYLLGLGDGTIMRPLVPRTAGHLSVWPTGAMPSRPLRRECRMAALGPCCAVYGLPLADTPGALLRMTFHATVALGCSLSHAHASSSLPPLSNSIGNTI